MAHQPHTHAHRAEIGDTIDFVNTFGSAADGSPIDELDSDARVVAWLIERGLVHPDRRRIKRRTDIAARAHKVREALRALMVASTARQAPDAATISELNRALRAVAAIEIGIGETGCTLVHRHVGDPVDDALGRIVGPIVRVVTAGELFRLRLCENARCRTAFVDTSRAGTRRWCDMTTCGNRAKAARHRSRARVVTVVATETA